MDEVKNQVKKDLAQEIKKLVEEVVRDELEHIKANMDEINDRLENCESDISDHDDRLDSIEYYDMDEFVTNDDLSEKISDKIDDEIYDRELVSATDESYEELLSAKDDMITCDTFEYMFSREGDDKFIKFFNSIHPDKVLDEEEEIEIEANEQIADGENK